MQTINEELNSNAKLDSGNSSDTDLRKIIEVGRSLTADEQNKLLKMLGQHCSKRIKKLIRQRISMPTNQWCNHGAYAKVLFRCDGDVAFKELQHYRKKWLNAAINFLGFLDHLPCWDSCQANSSCFA